MSCTPEINAANAARAAKERPGIMFAAVDVSITKADDVSIWFTTRGTDDNPHPYTCRQADVWLECPSTARAPGDRGSLLLSSTALAAKSLKDGTTRIKGTIPDLTGKIQINVKWPDNAGDAEPVASLEIWPTKIIIEGYAHDDRTFQGRISLLDPNECASSQAIILDSSRPITLSLTEEGFHRFSLPLPNSGSGDPPDEGTEAPVGTGFDGGGSAAAGGGASALWELVIGYLAEAVAERIERDHGRSRAPQSFAPAGAAALSPPPSAPRAGVDVRQAIERITREFADLKKAISAS
jgi:uncharacterized membrane protein YgcG